MKRRAYPSSRFRYAALVAMLAGASFVTTINSARADLTATRPILPLYSYQTTLPGSANPTYVTSSRTSIAGYTRVGTEGDIFSPSASQPPGTVAVWTYIGGGALGVRYTGTGAPASGYQQERLEGYAFTAPALGTAPLRMWTNQTTGGRRLTNHPEWVQNASGKGGPGNAWTFNRTVGWVVPERKVNGAGLGGGTYYIGQPPFGQRPLLVLLIDFQNDEQFTAAHTIAYYQQLFFGTVGDSAYNNYRALTHDRFTWRAAGPGVIKVTYPGTLAQANVDPNYRKTLVRLMGDAMVAQQRPLLSFDTDGDRIVEAHELAIFMIRADVGSPDFGGQTAWMSEPRTDPGGQPYTITTRFSYSQEHLGLYLVSHELLHQVGDADHDIYGGAGVPDAAYSDSLTLTSYSGQILDPWLRMRFGWDAPLVWHPYWGGNCVRLPTSDLYQTGAQSSVAIVDPLHKSAQNGLEYFLIESRAKRGWDRWLRDAKGGLAIWQVLTDANHNIYRATTPTWNPGGDNSLWAIGSPGSTWSRRGSPNLWRHDNTAAKNFLAYFNPTTPEDVTSGTRIVNFWPGSLDGRPNGDPALPHTSQDVEWSRRGDTIKYLPRVDTAYVTELATKTSFDIRGAFGVDDNRRTAWKVQLKKIGSSAAPTTLTITSKGCERITAEKPSTLAPGSYNILVKNTVTGTVVTGAALRFQK
jgi:hypothetical protein